jgi:CheY-like chemotaxis protein
MPYCANLSPGASLRVQRLFPTQNISRGDFRWNDQLFGAEKYLALFGTTAACYLCELNNGQDIVRAGLMSPHRLNNLTVVVVEDHDDARRYLGAFLGHLGASVVLARDGVEGLEAIKKSHPDLVVSDINMPRMDGFELLRQIRALGPDGAGKVPVIAMTAVVSHADRARMLNAGFQGCLPKPFTPDKLVETILNVLND